MFKKTLAAALVSAIALMGVAGSASAGTLNDDFDITLTVDAMCAITQAPNDINMTHDASFGTGGMGFSNLGIVCNQDLPFTVEVDTGVGGAALLVDAATSKSVPATVRILAPGTFNFGIWGSLANGEAVSHIGTGLSEFFGIQATYDQGFQPAVGFYEATQNIVVSF